MGFRNVKENRQRAPCLPSSLLSPSPAPPAACSEIHHSATCCVEDRCDLNWRLLLLWMPLVPAFKEAELLCSPLPPVKTVGPLSIAAKYAILPGKQRENKNLHTNEIPSSSWRLTLTGIYPDENICMCWVEFQLWVQFLQVPWKYTWNDLHYLIWHNIK